MKHLIAFLTAITLACTAASVSAVTYSIEGTITSSTVAAFPEGATYRYTFDYDPALVTGTPDGSAAERYEDALTNATLVIESPLAGTTLYTLSNTRMMVVRTSVDHQLYLEFYSMTPAPDGPAFIYGLVAYYGETNIWTSNAPPADLSSQPWTGGGFWLEFAEDVHVEGDTVPPSAIPEPSTALLGALGALALLRRRRA